MGRRLAAGARPAAHRAAERTSRVAGDPGRHDDRSERQLLTCGRAGPERPRLSNKAPVIRLRAADRAVDHGAAGAAGRAGDRRRARGDADGSGACGLRRTGSRGRWRHLRNDLAHAGWRWRHVAARRRILRSA